MCVSSSTTRQLVAHFLTNRSSPNMYYQCFGVLIVIVFDHKPAVLHTLCTHLNKVAVVHSNTTACAGSAPGSAPADYNLNSRFQTVGFSLVSVLFSYIIQNYQSHLHFVPVLKLIFPILCPVRSVVINGNIFVYLVFIYCTTSGIKCWYLYTNVLAVCWTAFSVIYFDTSFPYAFDKFWQYLAYLCHTYWWVGQWSCHVVLLHHWHKLSTYFRKVTVLLSS